MEFVLQKEQQEAERKRIEAAGIRDSGPTLGARHAKSYPIQNANELWGSAKS